jgi:hypothetical protein
VFDDIWYLSLFKKSVKKIKSFIKTWQE